MRYIEIIGLGLNFLGALVLSMPLLRSEGCFDEETDTVIDRGETKGGFKWTTRRMKKDATLARLGAGLVVVGFLLQFIAKF
jgi:hypothetical protein